MEFTEVGVVGDGEVIVSFVWEEGHRRFIADLSRLGVGDQHHQGSMTRHTVEFGLSI